ncbi:MAG: DUF438 domain-containing protein [Candidatus Kapabacteria bacterium]|nr:DUF438 domain-containing protein [Candidatus Kapabacteria bacterium]
MSELINNSENRKSILKELILKLHKGDNPEQVRAELEATLTNIPYGEVVEVEQELVAEGLPVDEIQKLCDIHSFVLQGRIDLSAVKIVLPGHPVDTMKKENREIENLIAEIKKQIGEIAPEIAVDDLKKQMMALKGNFNALMDIDKHYKRKEFLIFPYLEKIGITAPPKVMWGKHDEIREQLKGILDSLVVIDDAGDFAIINKTLIEPALFAILDMIVKEEKILLPMTLDKLTEIDWYEIYQQTGEYGYCLYDPKIEWKPQVSLNTEKTENVKDDFINFPTGRLNYEEMLGILSTLPVDITFVDKDDKVKFFSEGKDRVFDRSRAILLRDVRLCHPPSSMHIVDKIIEDFRSGREDKTAFWINFQGKFVFIEYYAVRDKNGDYLGTLEVTQDLTTHRQLEGEQRLLSYGDKK